MLRRAGPMLFLFAVAMLVAMVSAKATIIGPSGGSGTATVFTTPTAPAPGLTTALPGVPMGTVADTGVQDWFVAGAEGAIGGKYRALVVKDAANFSFGCTGSCLTFLIMVSNTDIRSTKPIQRVGNSSYGSFMTDIGYVSTWSTGYADTPPNSGLAGINAVDRNAAGVVGFNWSDSAGISFPLGGSSVLAIRTNATNWKLGDISISQGVATSVLGFAPTAVEPASALLLGVSLLMGGVFRKKLFA